MSSRTKRTVDLILSAIVLLIIWPLLVAVAISVKFDSSGPALHRSERIGVGGQKFTMLKFRSMSIDTPQVATHLLDEPASHVTRVGNFLRRTSVDELPQLVNVVRGEMSLVGPRPALFNQDDLIQLRQAQGIDRLLPGLTGLAQVMGRDSISIEEKVDLEREYLDNQSLRLDVEILLRTLQSVVSGKDIRN